MSRARALSRTPSPFDPFIRKFNRLTEIEKILSRNKRLYVEYDQLVTDLLPLFIHITGNKIVIDREITLGTKRFRLTPVFIEPRGLKATNWKSTAFKSFTVESI